MYMYLVQYLPKMAQREFCCCSSQSAHVLAEEQSMHVLAKERAWTDQATSAIHSAHVKYYACTWTL